MAIVSNHCGWTDILVHMARSFPSFVARADTVRLTMIGLIRWQAGAVPRALLSASRADQGCCAASTWAACTWTVPRLPGTR